MSQTSPSSQPISACQQQAEIRSDENEIQVDGRQATAGINRERVKPLYQDSGYNRNSTLAAKYVNRILPDFPTPSERYYDIRVVSSENRRSYFGEVGDQCIMFHSNRVSVITLAPSHPVIVEDKTILRIEHTFEGFEKIDRLATQPKGKSKKGSQKLQKNSPICAIVCSDDTKYVITACMGSMLIEVNQLICTQPNLVKERPLSSGFIAITQPNDWKRMAEFRDSLPKLGQESEPVQEKGVDVRSDAG